LLSGIIDAPQTRQTRGGRGGVCVWKLDPFVSRLLLSVNRVGGPTLREGFAIVDHNSRETHSAIGATARPHVRTVSDSRTANDPMRRQLPSRCSKNHSRRIGSRVIQSKT